MEIPCYADSYDRGVYTCGTIVPTKEAIRGGSIIRFKKSDSDPDEV